MNSLIDAIAAGEVDIVRDLVQRHPELLMQRDEDGQYPIHHAAIGGNVDIIESLIRIDPRVEHLLLTNGDNMVPLWCATEPEAISILFRANPNAIDWRRNITNVPGVAIGGGDVNHPLRRLIRTHDENFSLNFLQQIHEIFGEDTRTQISIPDCLLDAVRQRPDPYVRLIGRLLNLDRNAISGIVDPTGRPFMFEIFSQAPVEFIRKFLDVGLRIMNSYHWVPTLIHRDENDNTIFHRIAHIGDIQCANLLRMVTTVRLRGTSTLEMWRDNIRNNFQGVNREGLNILHLSARWGNSQFVQGIIEWILQMGGYPQLRRMLNTGNNNGWTPIHYGIKFGSIGTFGRFLHLGSHLDRTNGRIVLTPMDIAIKRQDETLRLMIFALRDLDHAQIIEGNETIHNPDHSDHRRWLRCGIPANDIRRIRDAIYFTHSLTSRLLQFCD